MKKMIAGLAVAAAMAFGAPDSAEAQKQDGLVNVVVGDITILEDVNVAVAANVVAQICGVNVSGVALLASLVDQSSRTRTVCRLEDGDKVRIVQN